MLTTYNCNRYHSTRNLFLLYSFGSRKGKSFNADYNCYVTEDYLNENEAFIDSKIIKTVVDEDKAKSNDGKSVEVPDTSEEKES